MTGEVNTWVAGSAGNWNVDENWSLGHVPTSTEVATFDNTSDNNCAINAAPDVYGMNLATGYDGTVTQGSVDIALGAGGYAQAAGTFTGATGKTVTCAGSFTHTGGTITSSKLSLRMTGDGATLTFNAAVPLSVTISANVSYSHGTASTLTTLIVDSGKTLAIVTGKTLYTYIESYTNGGTIDGPGTLTIYGRMSDATCTIGAVNAPLVIAGHASMTANRVLTSGANTILGSTLTVQSAHASNTMTLDMAGKTLSATAITVSTRAVLTNSGASAACSCSGAFTVSGASSVVSGAIALTYGTYVQSNGTATQVNNWSGGAVTASGGTLTGAGSASVTLTSSGDVNLTGATVTADKLHIVMTGAGKTLAVGAAIITLTVSGTTSLGGHIQCYNLANTGTLKIGAYDINWEYGAYSNGGLIIGTTGRLKLKLYDADKTIVFGMVSANVWIYGYSTMTADRTVTVGADTTLGGTLAVESAHETSTITLDLAGRSANVTGAVTVGTRGNILWGEGVHHLAGNLDTSAGASNFETCQIVLTKSCTLKTGADQPLYDLLIAPGVTVTLGSDVTVSHIYANGGRVIPGAYTLTASGQSYDLNNIPANVRANLNPVIEPLGKRFMRRHERVN